MITFEEANKRLAYYPDTGEIRWKTHSIESRTGTVAGYGKAGEYLRITLTYTVNGAQEKRSIPIHQLAWLLTYGSLPEKPLMIDHENGRKDQNNIKNLRAITPTGNNLNVHTARKTNKLGKIGVKRYLTNSGERFASTIYIGTKAYHLGSFDTVEEAYERHCEVKDLILQMITEQAK